MPIVITAGILVIVAGGYALWRTQNGKRVEPVAAPAAAVAAEPLLDTTGGAGAVVDTTRGLAPTVIAAPASTPAAGTSTSAAPSPAKNSAAPVAPSVTAPPSTPIVPGDSVRWERAIVRSDVNLRKTAGRDGESLRVLRIDQPVELGAFQEGWRQVRLGTVIGWADPRHFEIVPRKR